MKTGVIVLAMHADSPAEREVASRAARFLTDKGRKNVRIAFHLRDAESVMFSMHDEGVDTYCILPLTVSEGRQTVWLMPSELHLPDNCGSWTIIDGRDVATRFATALGSDPRMAEALVRREGTPVPGTALLLVARGSPNSQLSKVSEYYANALREIGWRAVCGYSRYGVSVAEAVDGLRADGFGSVRVIPLFIGFDGHSASKIKSDLVETGMAVDYSLPISDIEEFYRILDSKVPDGW